MKIGDQLQIGDDIVSVTKKVYDQSQKKTVFYAGDRRLTGDEKPVEEKNVIVEKLEAVESAIKSIPKVEIPEFPKFPEFPEQKEFPAFPEFPKSMTVNVPDLSSIEGKLDTIINKEDYETRELIKNALEELKKTKSDIGVVSAIQKLAAIIPKSQDYTDLLKEISDKLNPITQEDLKINKEQWKELTKALSSIGGFGGGPGAVQLRTESGTIINPATEEKQNAIVSAIENITIPAPAGGATEVNQETLISLIGTLQELSQRLAPLASAMNSGAPGLRVTPNAATLPVSGTVTATVASTVVSSLTNFGTGIPASEMAHDMNNMTAVLSNINNASA